VQAGPPGTVPTSDSARVPEGLPVYSYKDSLVIQTTSTVLGTAPSALHLGATTS
jgi:hypothetical protein